MSKIHFYLTTIIIVLLLGCQSKQSGDQKAGVEKEEASFPINETKGGSYESVSVIRAQAKALIDNRIKESDNAFSVITTGFWNPEFIFNEKMSTPNQYEGYWIDFKEDFGYEYGYYSEVLGTGMYYFRLDDKSLIMLDDDISYEPKFWEVIYNGRGMALQGSHELGINNGMQIKLLALDNKPVKI